MFARVFQLIQCVSLKLTHSPCLDVFSRGEQLLTIGSIQNFRNLSNHISRSSSVVDVICCLSFPILCFPMLRWFRKDLILSLNNPLCFSTFEWYDKMTLGLPRWDILQQYNNKMKCWITLGKYTSKLIIIQLPLASEASEFTGLPWATNVPKFLIAKGVLRSCIQSCADSFVRIFRLHALFYLVRTNAQKPCSYLQQSPLCYFIGRDFPTTSRINPSNYCKKIDPQVPH